MTIKDFLETKLYGKNFNAFRVKHLIASILGVLTSVILISLF